MQYLLECITIEQAAEEAGVTKQHIWRLLRGGKFRAVVREQATFQHYQRNKQRMLYRPDVLEYFDRKVNGDEFEAVLVAARSTGASKSLVHKLIKKNLVRFEPRRGKKPIRVHVGDLRQYVDTRDEIGALGAIVGGAEEDLFEEKRRPDQTIKFEW